MGGQRWATREGEVRGRTVTAPPSAAQRRPSWPQPLQRLRGALGFVDANDDLARI